MNTEEIMFECGVIPVIEIEKPEYSEPLGKALQDGGLPVAEITFRTDAALQAIEKMASLFPAMQIGAGSVLSIRQSQAALDHGAKFIVSPGSNLKIVDWCLERSVPVFPGVATPSEIMMAVDRGLSILKFFPAEQMGGPKMLQAVSAPFRGVKFIPTGGIRAENLADYLKLPAVYGCGGSWLVSKKLMGAGRFDEITRLVKEALSIVRSVRESHA